MNTEFKLLDQNGYYTIDFIKTRLHLHEDTEKLIQENSGIIFTSKYQDVTQISWNTGFGLYDLVRVCHQKKLIGLSKKDFDDKNNTVRDFMRIATYPFDISGSFDTDKILDLEPPTQEENTIAEESAFQKENTGKWLSIILLKLNTRAFRHVMKDADYSFDMLQIIDCVKKQVSKEVNNKNIQIYMGGLVGWHDICIIAKSEEIRPIHEILRNLSSLSVKNILSNNAISPEKDIHKRYLDTPAFINYFFVPSLVNAKSKPKAKINEELSIKYDIHGFSGSMQRIAKEIRNILVEKNIQYLVFDEKICMPYNGKINDFLAFSEKVKLKILKPSEGESPDNHMPVLTFDSEIAFSDNSDEHTPINNQLVFLENRPHRYDLPEIPEEDELISRLNTMMFFFRRALRKPHMAGAFNSLVSFLDRMHEILEEWAFFDEFIREHLSGDYEQLTTEYHNDNSKFKNLFDSFVNEKKIEKKTSKNNDEIYKYKFLQKKNRSVTFTRYRQALVNFEMEPWQVTCEYKQYVQKGMSKYEEGLFQRHWGVYQALKHRMPKPVTFQGGFHKVILAYSFLAHYTYNQIAKTLFPVENSDLLFWDGVIFFDYWATEYLNDTTFNHIVFPLIDIYKGWDTPEFLHEVIHGLYKKYEAFSVNQLNSNPTALKMYLPLKIIDVNKIPYLYTLKHEVCAEFIKFLFIDKASYQRYIQTVSSTIYSNYQNKDLIMQFNKFKQMISNCFFVYFAYDAHVNNMEYNSNNFSYKSLVERYVKETTEALNVIKNNTTKYSSSIDHFNKQLSKIEINFPHLEKDYSYLKNELFSVSNKIYIYFKSHKAEINHEKKAINSSSTNFENLCDFSFANNDGSDFPYDIAQAMVENAPLSDNPHMAFTFMTILWNNYHVFMAKNFPRNKENPSEQKN